MTREQSEAVTAARRALAMSLQESSPPDQVMALAIVAISGAFADIIAASPGAPDLIAVVNRQLAGSGWEIVPAKRN